MSAHTPDGLWGASGPIVPARTLILAHGLGTRGTVPTEEDMDAATQWADGVEFDVVLLADGPAVMHPFADRWGLDLKIGDRHLSRVTSRDIGILTNGPAPMMLDRVLRRLRGKPKNCELKDGYAAADLTRILGETATDPSELVVTSFIAQVPPLVRAYRGAAAHPKAGLVLCPGNPQRNPIRDAFPHRLLAETGSECAAVHWRLYRSSVLRRSGRRPGIVWTVNEEPELRLCFEDTQVRAVITDEPELAYRVRAELS